MKKITQRQLIIFYCIYSFAIKFLLLPQLLTRGAGNDAWIVALVGTIIEITVLHLVLRVLVLRKDSDISKISLPHKSKFIPLFLIFLLQIMILTKQSYYLLSENMFEDLSVYMFVIPMLMLGIYLCFTSSRSIFRSGEIFYVFLIIGIAFSVFPSLGQINPREVLPVFSGGLTPILITTLFSLIYFESASFLLMFCGEIKIEENFQKKFMTTAVIVGVFFIFFVFMFWSLFGGVASSKNVAVANMTGYSSLMAQGGRTGWVLVSIWLLLLLLRFGITFFCAFKCIKYITGAKKCAGVISLSLAVTVLLLSAFVFAGMRDLEIFILSMRWVILALYFAIPLWFFVGSKKEGAENV